MLRAAVFVLCAAGSALGLLKIGDSTLAAAVAEEAAAVDVDKKNESKEESAVLRARSHTSPEIVPNVSDTVWYRDYYDAPLNALMNLSWTSSATQPTPEEAAAEDAREEQALEDLIPQLEAETQEADRYYHQVYPVDKENDLETFSYKRR
mmetsp:Transcript_74880/g.173580  ORF Transcript_74880/g.173580 Transcript_74880/m.173580 type:complete len:150 (+) Transcript_74880:88-537(+)